MISYQIIGKNKLGDDIEGVRTRAAAMVRAKHKINKITIQVIFLQDYHEAERSDFFLFHFPGGDSTAGCGSRLP